MVRGGGNGADDDGDDDADTCSGEEEGAPSRDLRASGQTDVSLPA